MSGKKFDARTVSIFLGEFSGLLIRSCQGFSKELDFCHCLTALSSNPKNVCKQIGRGHLIDFFGKFYIVENRLPFSNAKVADWQSSRLMMYYYFSHIFQAWILGTVSSLFFVASSPSIRA